MSVICPICKSPAQELPRTGHASHFRCKMHDDFKVADAVSAELRAEAYASAQWEIALQKAKQRTKPGEWPVIRASDF
jgi:hypothetical protein